MMVPAMEKRLCKRKRDCAKLSSAKSGGNGISSCAVLWPMAPPHQDERFSLGAAVVPSQADKVGVELAEVKIWLLFQKQCLPHLSLLLSDAVCLTSHPEVATDLVLETYRHAARTFRDCQREQIPAQLSGPATLAWLRRIMHACFCQHCLSETPQ